MKILLTGKNGQVGFELRRSLAILGEVVAMDVAECDLSDPDSIRQMVHDQRPDVIVNPAAYTAVDKAEQDVALAERINAGAPAVLAQAAEQLGALLVHYSTDYVFDGLKTGAYTEDDAPKPQNVYGATKLAGERAVMTGCRQHLILRTSWVVGAHGGNFAKTMLRLAAERDRLNVVSDQFGVPTSAALLADITAQLIRQYTRERASFPYGLYHAVPSGVTNWHEYACHVIEYARAAGKSLRVAPDAIYPITTADYPVIARRPANSRLDTTKLRDAFGLHLPSWQDSLALVLDQLLGT